jgi:predicted site-specific integrase-resolvase
MYFRASKVMTIMKITRATLRSWINTGKLRAFRVGKNNMIDPIDLADFLQARQTTA